MRVRTTCYISTYYAFLGDAMSKQMLQAFPAAPEAVRTVVKGFTDIGADELMLWPCIPELEQIQRLADLVHG